jgi:hypothetical protein
VSSELRPSEPPVIFREQAPRSLPDKGDDEGGQASAVALPAGLLRRLWLAAAGLGLALLAVAIAIAQLSR